MITFAMNYSININFMNGKVKNLIHLQPFTIILL